MKRCFSALSLCVLCNGHSSAADAVQSAPWTNGSQAILPFTFTNNDEGATYIGATLRTNIFAAIYNGIPAWQSRYPTLADFTAFATSVNNGYYRVTFTVNVSSRIETPWSATTGASGETSLNLVTNPLGWRPWTEGRTVSGYYAVGGGLLDLTGDLEPDYAISLTKTQRADMFTAAGGGALVWRDFGYDYLVTPVPVPEPASVAVLAGLSGFGAVIFRRREAARPERPAPFPQ